MVPTLLGVLWLVTCGLHDLDCRLRIALHGQGNGLVAAVCYNNQLNIGLFGKCVVNGVIITATSTCCLAVEGFLVSGPHQDGRLEEVVQSGSCTPTVVSNLQNIGLQGCGIIHINHDCRCLVLNITEDGEALAIYAEAGDHTAVIELVENIGINVFLGVETFDVQIADLNLLAGVQLGQLTLGQNGKTLKVTITVLDVSAGIVGVVVDTGSCNIVNDLFENNLGAVGITYIEEVLDRKSVV